MNPKHTPTFQLGYKAEDNNMSDATTSKTIDFDSATMTAYKCNVIDAAAKGPEALKAFIKANPETPEMSLAEHRLMDIGLPLPTVLGRKASRWAPTAYLGGANNALTVGRNLWFVGQKAVQLYRYIRG